METAAGKGAQEEHEDEDVGRFLQERHLVARACTWVGPFKRGLPFRAPLPLKRALGPPLNSLLGSPWADHLLSRAAWASGADVLENGVHLGIMWCPLVLCRLLLVEIK